MTTSYASLFTGAPADHSSASAPADASPDRPYGVLLVDDEPNVLSALRRVFRQEHYEIVTAGSGTQALAALQERAFEVVVSDFMMPGMDGGELLRRVRSLQPDTIRILLTGHADVAAVVAAVKAGAVYKFMLKPWNDDDLRLTVARAIEQHELVRRNRELARSNDSRARELEALAKLAVSNRSQIAMVLHKRGLLTSAQVQELFRLQQQRKQPLLAMILDRGWADESAVHAILRKELLVEEVSPEEFSVDAAVASLVPAAMCRRQVIVPLKLEGRRLVLAMADPLDTGLLDDLRFTIGLEIQPVLAAGAAIRAKIDQIHGPPDDEGLMDLSMVGLQADPIEGIEVLLDEDPDDASLADLLKGSDEPPAIRLVNAAILEAIRLGASDVHVQPRAKNVVVRYRIDGILHDKIQIPHTLHQSFVSRVKIMAELDISERRRPQDGRLTVKTPSRVVDLRISTLPTINGEKVVMRMLDRNAAVLRIEGLGLSSADLERIERVTAKPQGIVLATGPTGSGKTTTLYSLLQHGLTPEKNYVSIEDPVEYYMDQAGQVHIRERIGLTFPTVLRAILRQDPDVVLLGEIRDLETAEVAFHAALTGHQVFSTLHAGSAVATVARLRDLGLKPFVIATALEAIVAQRLVRRLCPQCRQEARPDARTAQLLALPAGAGRRPSYRGAGCAACHGAGYKGRLGVYEVLVPDDELRSLISDGAGLRDLTRAALASGVRTLHDDALCKMEAGLTSAEEVLRVLGPATPRTRNEP